MTDKTQRTGMRGQGGYAEALLARLLSAVKGQHPESYREGYKTGFLAARAKASEQAAVPPSVITREVAIRLEDARGNEATAVKFDALLLDDGRMRITPAMTKQFKADALIKLGEDHQPTEEQWKAILSPTTSAVTIGIAGTGKTFVMMMRAVLMHCYLEIPLSDMTILAVTKDCRFEVIAELGHLFARWGVQLSQEQSLDLVKTPRGALLRIIRTVPPLRDVIPFELLGLLDAGDEDGHPFDPRLSAGQSELIAAAYQDAYTRSSLFAESVQTLFAETVCLPRAAPDNAALIRYSEQGTLRIMEDELLAKAVTSHWHSSGHWPVQAIEPVLTPLSIMGKQVLANGYFPLLDAYVVLGFPKDLTRDYCRTGVSLPLYDECLAKRAFLQRFSMQRIIWCDSPEQLEAIIDTASALADTAPKFKARVKGLERPVGIAECLYQTGALIETLGLDPGKTISTLRFMPHDPDAQFFDCAAKFWPLFESFLLAAERPVMTLNRLFLTFGEQGHRNLKAVPTEALKGLRNVLTDELQDVTVHTGEFIKACMAENRYRIEVEGINDAVMSVFACGDDFQTAHGTQGATPRYLTDFKEHFPSKGYVLNLLGVNFRSQQGIIYAAHSLVLGIPAVSTLAPASAANELSNPVEVLDLTPAGFMSLFDMHYAEGDSILILAANPDDYKHSEPFLSVVVERDRAENPGNHRVRVRAAQRSKGLEADCVFIIGDFVASTSTWAKNQIFRLAKTVDTPDQSPFDVVQQNELYRLAHIGITRARKRCYWLLSPSPVDSQQRLKASTRITKVAGSFNDRR